MVAADEVLALTSAEDGFSVLVIELDWPAFSASESLTVFTAPSSMNK